MAIEFNPSESTIIAGGNFHGTYNLDSFFSFFLWLFGLFKEKFVFHTIKRRI